MEYLHVHIYNMEFDIAYKNGSFEKFKLGQWISININEYEKISKIKYTNISIQKYI